MASEYICDDRNLLEDVKKIRSMTDEEFETYMESLENTHNAEKTAQK